MQTRTVREGLRDAFKGGSVGFHFRRSPLKSSPRMPPFLRFLSAAYIFFLPVQFNAGLSRVAPSDLFIIFYVVIGFTRLRLYRQSWSILHWALVGIFLISTITTAIRLGALDTYILINKDVGLFLLLLTYAVITTAASAWDEVLSMLRIFLLSTTLHSALSVMALFLLKLAGVHALSSLLYLNSRVSGMLIDPNAFGGLLLTAFAIQGTTYFTERPIVKGWLGFAVMVVLGLGVLLTLSRSAWIGFGAAALLALLFRPKLTIAYSAIAIAGALALILALGPNLTKIMALANRPRTTQQRLDQITQALPMLSTSPIIGIGLGAFIEKKGWIIHNTTAWMLTEFGFIGLTVFLGLIFWYFARGFTTYRFADPQQRDVVLGLLCAHLGMFAVSFGIEAFYQRHWWFVMALIACAYRLITIPVLARSAAHSAAAFARHKLRGLSSPK